MNNKENRFIVVVDNLGSDTQLYLCDCIKNIGCSKTLCQKECYSTSNVKHAKILTIDDIKKEYASGCN